MLRSQLKVQLDAGLRCVHADIKQISREISRSRVGLVMVVVIRWQCRDVARLIPELVSWIVVGEEEVGKSTCCREDVPIYIETAYCGCMSIHIHCWRIGRIPVGIRVGRMLKLYFDPVLTQSRIQQHLSKSTDKHSTTILHASNRHVHITTHKSLHNHTLGNRRAKTWSRHL